MEGHHTALLLLLLLNAQFSHGQLQQINCSLPIGPINDTVEGEACKHYDTNETQKCHHTSFMDISELTGLADEYLKLTVENPRHILSTNETVLRVRVWPATKGQECKTRTLEVTWS